MNAMFYLFSIMFIWGAKADRINLVDFGQVVQFNGEADKVPETQPIERGIEGWTAYRAENGQYTIGVEWDEPRDVAEVNIEFRHAIANRDKIKVQYFQYHKPGGSKNEGNWATAKVAEWWAGDRDISFTFTPLAEEHSSHQGPNVTYRRTSRLRFVLGKEDLPPVRYIRVYGPNQPMEAEFEVQIPQHRLTPPFQISVVNGNLLEGEEGGKRTTTQTMQLESGPITLHVGYARGDSETPTRTQVTIRGQDSEEAILFSPVEIVAKGKISLGKDVVILHRKGESAATHPSASGVGQDQKDGK